MVELTVALALALAEFGDEEQNLFRMAISEAAGLPGEKVYLLEVDSFVARRSGSTRIRLAVQADNPRHAESMLPSLQQSRINEELAKVGLPSCVMLSEPKVTSSESINCEAFATCKNMGEYIKIKFEKYKALAAGTIAAIVISVIVALIAKYHLYQRFIRPRLFPKFKREASVISWSAGHPKDTTPAGSLVETGTKHDLETGGEGSLSGEGTKKQDDSRADLVFAHSVEKREKGGEESAVSVCGASTGPDNDVDSQTLVSLSSRDYDIEKSKRQLHDEELLSGSMTHSMQKLFERPQARSIIKSVLHAPDSEGSAICENREDTPPPPRPPRNQVHSAQGLDQSFEVQEQHLA